MFRSFMIIFFIGFTYGCSNQIIEEKKPNGEWILAMPERYPEQKISETSTEEWQEIFATKISFCEASALDAPIPKPKCRVSAPVRNCHQTKSFNSTFCAKPITSRSCDIKSTQRYNDAIFNHVKNCMNIAGWQWLPLNKNS